jgi:hypothetical protein
MRIALYLVAVAFLWFPSARPAFSQIKEVFPLFEPAFTHIVGPFPRFEPDSALERMIAEARIKSITRWKYDDTSALPDTGKMIDSTYYDMKGRVSGTSISASNMNPQRSVLLSYNEAGRLVQVDQCMLSGAERSLSDRITYRYNSRGQKGEMISQASQGRTTYQYNEAGVLTEEMVFDRDGVYLKTIYVYDKGKLVEVRSYGKGVMKETPDQLIKYAYDGNWQTEAIFQHGSQVERHDMKLDAKGRILERRGYDSHTVPAPLLKQLFIYNEEGALLSETIHCESNPMAPDMRQVYTYDEKGLPMTQKKFRGSKPIETTKFIYGYWRTNHTDHQGH